MFGIETTSQVAPQKVVEATQQAAFKNFGHAGARISKDAKALIITDDEPSPEGSPPHTRGRGGHNLRGAIRFDATKQDVVVGPMASYVGESGRAHELGEDFKGQDFEQRAFMVPAMENNIARFASDWAGSIGE